MAATPSPPNNVSNAPGSLALDGGTLSLASRPRPTITTTPSGAVSLLAGRGSRVLARESGLVWYSNPAATWGNQFLVGPTTEFRLALIGDDGSEFVQPFWPASARLINGCLYVQPAFYPRQSRNITVRIEERAGGNDSWQTAATFHTRIQPQPLKTWTAEATPVHKSQRGAEMVIDEVAIESTPLNRSKYETILSYLLLENSVPQTDWTLVSLRGADAGGNSGYFTMGTDRIGEGFKTRSAQFLNPNQVWWLQAIFWRHGDPSDANIYTFEFFVQPVNKTAKP
jgi:hypothetical protein